MKPITLVTLGTVGSTNTYAKQNIQALTLPSLITADKQTAGRGRHGKSFYSPDKTGLYMTLVFEAPDECELITPAAAVAVCNALESYGINPQIKWVNDVYIGMLKVCGILAESFLHNGKKYIALGIGINLTTNDFPSDIPNPGSINIDCNKTELALMISEQFLSLTDSKYILDEYEKRLFVIGKEVSYTKNGTEFTATVKGINSLCNLIVCRSDGIEETLSSGEISVKMR
ncbi:MAG: biotin--[acetyl-CoA-carboxylase] ligase [Ruminococcaceae bacterium]|nr:biotin--[acetyl-CoA-carboxylase] ligase [Oscillospiraceae bacterium]